MGLAIAEAPVTTEGQRVPQIWRLSRYFLAAACAWASLVLTNGALRDIAALQILRSMSTVEDLYRAVTVAPSNIEARMLLAHVLVGADRCDLAEPHLKESARLQPFSGAVTNLRDQCYYQTMRSR
jgi:cytochrome c-type biogenesis protein CcmH/NrfG